MQIDVWASHTSSCSSCRATLKRFKQVQAASVFAVVWAVVLAVQENTALALLVATVSVIVNLLAGKACRVIEGEVAPSGIADRSVAAMSK